MKRYIYAALVAACLCLIVTFAVVVNNSLPEATGPCYRVRLSNWLGHANYYCESYRRDGETYYLYGADGDLRIEITVSPGYVMQVERLR